MKRDNLEEYIVNNKDQWNTLKAPDHIWQNIEEELEHSNSNSNNPWKKIIWIIAIILGLLSAYYFMSRTSESATQKDFESQLEFAELENFQETDNYYRSAINVNYEKLQKYALGATLEEDLRLLDENYNDLLEDYKSAQGFYKEQVLRAMILNQKTKLQILENVLLNHEQNETNEGTTIL